jgi:hypothetical protein
MQMTKIEPFLHTFTATPIREGYVAPAVRHGLNVYPVLNFEGRDCYITGSQRIRQNVAGRGYYNSLSVHFLDDGSIRQIPAGKFNGKVKASNVLNRDRETK